MGNVRMIKKASLSRDLGGFIPTGSLCEPIPNLRICFGRQARPFPGRPIPRPLPYPDGKTPSGQVERSEIPVHREKGGFLRTHPPAPSLRRTARRKEGLSLMATNQTKIHFLRGKAPRKVECFSHIFSPRSEIPISRERGFIFSFGKKLRKKSLPPCADTLFVAG
jgi:hypothetical protein